MPLKELLNNKDYNLLCINDSNNICEPKSLPKMQNIAYVGLGGSVGYRKKEKYSKKHKLYSDYYSKKYITLPFLSDGW